LKQVKGVIMAVGEQLLDDVAGLEKRAHELAMEAGSKAADQAGALLGRYVELVDPNVAERIEAEEFNRSFGATLEARESGRLNDTFSTAPGITIFMTREGFEGAKETAGDDSEYMGDYLATVEMMDEEGRLYALRLPEGGFYASMGFTFYGETTVDDLPLNGEKPFQFPTEAIVRVEGDTGDLWQNVNFQPDGTPIER
jgi:hypothetical protein